MRGWLFRILMVTKYNSELNTIMKASNQSFTAILKLKKPISKIEK